jgi:DNA processing protein
MNSNLLYNRNNSGQSLEEKLSWLRLIRTDNVGPVTFYRLIERYGSAKAAIEALPELSRKGGGKRPLKVPPPESVEKEYEKLKRYGGDIITVAEEDYPLALSACEDAPPVLSIKGRRELLNTRCIAMVGARNASYNGRKFAAKLAGDLGEAGLTVISGMARGIDTAAHNGSVNTGTIAVVAGGIDIVYPEENRSLYEKIAEGGLVIAENAFGFKPRPQDFPRRNRIVSGLSEGVIVVEASLRSGSLITARLAGEQGRDVFAVPGYPMDPRAQGPNKLIRDGAVLVEDASHIIEVLNSFSASSMRDNKHSYDYESFENSGYGEPDDPDSSRQILLDNLSHTAIGVDELIHACHLTIPVAQTLLLELELAGRLQRHSGGRVSLVD